MELNSRFAEDPQSDDDLGSGKCLRLAAYFRLSWSSSSNACQTIFNHAVRSDSVNAVISEFMPIMMMVTDDGHLFLFLGIDSAWLFHKGCCPLRRHCQATIIARYEENGNRV
jgi:hypothetical protein